MTVSDLDASAAGGAPEAPIPARLISTPLGWGAQAAYGVGQIAGQVFRDVPSLLLLFFMTNALGIGPALAGAAIFIPKLVFGVVCDVGVGVLSDRLNRRIPRRWWLLVGAVGAPFALILLFHVPVASEVGKAAYVACAFSLYMAVFAVLSVPYLAIAGELSTEPRQRTVIMAWRLVFTAVGVLIAGSFSPIFIQTQGGGQQAYEALSFILAAICPVALIVGFFAARQADRRKVESVAPPLSRGFPIREALAALAAPRFSVLVGSNLLMLISSGMAYASMIYFITYNLGRNDAFKQIGIITLIACATIVLAQPIWVKLASLLGKQRTYVLSAVLYGLLSVAWGVFGRLGLGVDYALAALLGLSNSGWSLMGFSMVSDLSDDGRGGLYSSIWVATDKIGFALGGTLIVGLLLSAFGFDSLKALAGAPQAPSAVTGVLLCFSIGPAMLSLIAAASFWRWGAKN
jgi:GPH family glycoside/pentoside/hexuronide:cation symporter